MGSFLRDVRSRSFSTFRSLDFVAASTLRAQSATAADSSAAQIINLPGLIRIQPGNNWPLLWQHFHQSLGIQVANNLPDYRTAYPQLVAQRTLNKTLPWLEQTSNDCITEPLKGYLP